MDSIKYITITFVSWIGFDSIHFLSSLLMDKNLKKLIELIKKWFSSSLKIKIQFHMEISVGENETFIVLLIV